MSFHIRFTALDGRFMTHKEVFIGHKVEINTQAQIKLSCTESCLWPLHQRCISGGKFLLRSFIDGSRMGSPLRHWGQAARLSLTKVYERPVVTDKGLIAVLFTATV